MLEFSTLIVRHIPGSKPTTFQVVRLRDGKTTEPAAVTSPVGYPVEGLPDSDLMRELQWYLETFLDYPFPPETDRADRVRDALRRWGEQAFDALFDRRDAVRFFDAATAADYARLHLQVSSDDPLVLSWPWEALYDPEVGHLAHTCQIERRLNKIRDPQPLPDRLPPERVNILLVTARPRGQNVRYRSISRPLFELIETHKLPAHVDVLRPPTLDALREHLCHRPGYYHILHFDGHGSYGGNTSGPMGPHTLQGPQGRLIFETANGQPDPITVDQLSVLLREHAVPAVVLNACQSARLDERADDPFASVAAALVKSGVRSVVAMAYSLYVSGAQQFLPAFYRRLFEEGSVAQAMRAGRQQMLAHRGRVCARGEFPLDDWLVPVLYQQDPLDFSFARQAKASFVRRPSKLPQDLEQESSNPHGFIGRDDAIQELERAMRRPPAGILISGLWGVGKTTLARGFLQWLDATDGLSEQCFWFTFRNIRSTEFVFNRMGEALYGPNFITSDAEKKIDDLAAAFRERQFIIVWDNFEVVRGIQGTVTQPNFSEADRQLLARFLDRLRGAPTKVIITSRSSEDWLGGERRYLLRLGGLEGEDRWDYCTAVLRDLGLQIDRDDPDFSRLMSLLDGHPLTMRVVLPRLADRTAARVAEELRSNLVDLTAHGDEEAKLYATLRFVPESVPGDLQDLLIAVSMHEGIIDADLLEIMAKEVDERWTRAQIDILMQILVDAGLLHVRAPGIYGMHPVLPGFLRSYLLPKTTKTSQDAWHRAFVSKMQETAQYLLHRPLHEQSAAFYFHSSNFHYALTVAERLRLEEVISSLTFSIGMHARTVHNWQGAASLFERLAAQQRALGNTLGEAEAINVLGMIAHDRHDWADAEKYYQEALELMEAQRNEANEIKGVMLDQQAASIYNNLGGISADQGDYDAAEQWFRKALVNLQTLPDLDDELVVTNRVLYIFSDFYNAAAATYSNLGLLAWRRRDFAEAEKWHRKSLAIDEKKRDEQNIARSHFHLGLIAEDQRDFIAAREWYHKALAIQEILKDQIGTASTCHHLGRIAETQGDFLVAERWYYKALAIKEKLGDFREAANTYHDLGVAARERNDLDSAEKWLRKALSIREKKLDDERGLADSYHELGIVAEERRDFDAAELWLRKSLAIEKKLGNEPGAASSYHELGIVAQARGDFAGAERWYHQARAIKERVGDEHHTASTYGQLGIIAGLQKKYIESGGWLVKSIWASLRTYDVRIAFRNMNNFLLFYRSAPLSDREKLRAMWATAGLGPFPEPAAEDPAES